MGSSFPGRLFYCTLLVNLNSTVQTSLSGSKLVTDWKLVIQDFYIHKTIKFVCEFVNENDYVLY